MSKSNFFIFEFVILLLIVAEFALLPKLIEKMPNTLINLPNKDYWLTSERSNETFATIRQFFDWLSAGLLILFIAVNQLVFQANIKQIDLPTTPMWTILGLFLIFVVIWLTFFVFRFRIKKDEN